MKLRFLVSITSVCLAGITYAESLFSAPDGWIDMELPNQHPGDVVAVQGFASPSGDTRISLTQLRKPITTQHGADELMRGQLASLEKGGYQHQETKETLFKGFEARIQQGRFQQKDTGKTLNVENYVVFTDSSVLSISLAYDSANLSPESARDVLDRVKIPGSMIRLKAGLGSIPGDSVAERSGYLAGQIAGYVLILALAIVGIRTLVNKAHRDRERILKAKQSGPDQPVTKSAVEPPVKDPTSTPTSMDAPR